MRLNRTSMELKLVFMNGRTGQVSLFESHLYGIETSGDAQFQKVVLPFESHLYGIETQRRSEPCLMKSKFESHLYGIETRIRH